MLKRPILHDLS